MLNLILIVLAICYIAASNLPITSPQLTFSLKEFSNQTKDVTQARVVKRYFPRESEETDVIQNVGDTKTTQNKEDLSFIPHVNSDDAVAHSAVHDGWKEQKEMDYDRADLLTALKVWAAVTYSQRVIMPHRRFWNYFNGYILDSNFEGRVKAFDNNDSYYQRWIWGQDKTITNVETGLLLTSHDRFVYTKIDDGSKNQKWVQDGLGRVKNVATGKFLDINRYREVFTSDNDGSLHPYWDT